MPLVLLKNQKNKNESNKTEWVTWGVENWSNVRKNVIIFENEQLVLDFKKVLYQRLNDL